MVEVCSTTLSTIRRPEALKHRAPISHSPQCLNDRTLKAPTVYAVDDSQDSGMVKEVVDVPSLLLHSPEMSCDPNPQILGYP